MTEDLLQFIWQNRYFNHRDLQLESGEPLTILSAGSHNTNQGPDFLHALIRLSDVTLAGHIEMHVFTSDWYKHGHTADSKYGNIILHVVWLDDCADHPLPIPTLVLQPRVSVILLETYRYWMNAAAIIPCGSHFNQVDPMILNKWKASLLGKRLQKKAIHIENELQKNSQHWEEVLWHQLAAGFGLQVNARVFGQIARSLPLRILQRHRSNRFQLEAMLFGQAGLLREQKDTYQAALKKEYEFLKRKYAFSGVCEELLFLRMRPANFPTIRLAQLAAFLQKKDQLFQYIRECRGPEEIYTLFDFPASEYWQTHFVFGQPTVHGYAQAGKQLARQLIINVFAPMVFSYGLLYKADEYTKKAIGWLGALPAEKNKIIAGWEELGAEIKNAGDSQAMLECKKYYCDLKKCLECGIGATLLCRPPKSEANT